jgi:mono/diheme cytochrome c family protein
MKIPVHFTSMLLMCAATNLVAGESAVRNTAESINKGRVLYTHMCKECHGSSGKAESDVIADSEDLDDPTGFRNGSSPEAIDKSIRDGAGVGMPAYGKKVKNPDDIIHMRNFIQSLWPAARRPAIVE